MGDELLHLGRWLFGYLLWERALFWLGRTTLRLVTFGRWPRRCEQAPRADWISAVGMLPLLALWLALACWNNRHG